MRLPTRPRLIRSIAILTGFALLVAACSSKGKDDEPVARPERTIIDGGPLGLRLSAGQAANVAAEPIAIVRGDPLGSAAVEAIVARLPDFLAADDDTTAFNRPAETLQPPLVGSTIDVPFGAAGDDPPPDVASGPLEVSRFQPEGVVDIAPFVSVTFNQPMVPLSTLDQLDDIEVPITIEPAIEGRWRWLGTRTARFDHTGSGLDRLPMATDFTVTIPAGTTSETGGRLADDVSFEFVTPAPTVRSITPNGDFGDLPTDPIFVITFDQKVDPAGVLGATTLEVDGRQVDLRVSTSAEIEADDDARAVTERTLEGRWVAFTPTELLSTDAAVRLTVGPNVPSAEGPNTIDDVEIMNARTYGPFEIDRAGCGDRCEPGWGISVELSNEIDTTTFDPSLVDVSPAIPGLVVQAFSNVLSVGGATAGNTTYEITVDRALSDIFGQPLTGDDSISVDVGPARPALYGFERPIVTLDPLADDPAVSVSVVNQDELRVRVFAVDTGDFPFLERMQESIYDDRREIVLPPDLVADETIDTGAEDHVRTEVRIPVGEYIDGGLGHLIVLVETTQEYDRDSEEYWNNRPVVAWAQRTNIGLDAFSDNDDVFLWTTDLRTGEPIGGVAVAGLTSVVTTSVDGTGSGRASRNGNRTLIATSGADTAILDGYWSSFPLETDSRWWVVDDRGLYRPGETVSITGFARERAPGNGLNLSRFAPDTPLTWQVTDARGVELGGGETTLDAAGAFSLTIDLPEGANLGSATVGFVVFGENAAFQHGFQIQEFRRPEFEVTARVENAGPHYATDATTLAATAAYFAGGPLPDSPVVWSVTTSDGQYAPPGWIDYTFGEWTPWWYDDVVFGGGRGFGAEADFVSEGDFGPCCFEDPSEFERYEGRTDASGTHYLQVDLTGDAPDLPLVIRANGAVEDVNRQSFADDVDVLIHAGRQYVGLKSDRAYVNPGDDLDVDVIVTDIDGTIVADRPVSVVAERVVHGYTGGTYGETVAGSETCDVTSGTSAVQCSFDTTDGGQYRITAIVEDEEGGKNRTVLTRWVAGGVIPQRTISLETVTLVPSTQELAPGDTLDILLQAPFGPGSALVTVVNEGIEQQKVVDVADDGSATVAIALTDAHVPGITVQVDVVGAAVRIDDDGDPEPSVAPRPAFATGSLTVEVPPVGSTLTVAATPVDSALAPGESTSVDVVVTGAGGAPVAGASVSVIVVDDAVLALSGYEPRDPYSFLAGTVGGYIQSQRMRESLVLTRTEDLAQGADGAEESGERAAATTTAGGSAGGGDDAADMDASAEAAPMAPDEFGFAGVVAPDTPIDVRTNFDALAVFAPQLTTDAAGRVAVDVDLPDNLTRYRVIAIAAEGDERFGAGESSLLARLPVQARPSPPRFLNFGDEFEFPVVVQNQTDQARNVDVVIETTNLSPRDARGVTVSVPANDRVEVRFPTEAALAGTARYRVTVVSGDRADSAQGELPVYTPTTTEAFATYGVLDSGTVGQTVLTPEGVISEYGGLEVSTSSTALQALTDAVLYLEAYPYESVDAFASRVLAIVSLRDVLDAFDAEGMPDPAAADNRVAADIDAIERLQNDDGGFGWWRREAQSSPFQSLHATHALVVADRNGYDVDDAVLENALFYLSEIRQFIPSEWDARTRDTLEAYALYVRDVAGRGDQARAQQLYRDGDLDLDGIAWLWTAVGNSAIEAEIERVFANRVVETPGAATFVSEYGEEAHLVLGSDRRTDGIVLGALIEMRPGSDLIPKVVTGLIGNQVQGRWNNVQENAFILLAMKDYFDTFEAQDPDFVARVWLGDLYASETTFAGRSTDTIRSAIPMTELVARADPQLVIGKTGVGRLYYRLGLKYAPDDLRLDPRDEGFVVSRTYESVDGSDDVTRRPDGTWEIAAGAEVKVTVSMVAESRRTNVALVDPLPAGLEAVNPALAASPELPRFEDEGGVSFSSYWYWQWYEFQNLRDDRVEAITTYLPAGTYEYTYVARATTPGTFVVPPTKAEEIYSPEVFGRAATDIVTVTP